MIAEFLEDSGDGALRRAFDKLKAGLQAEGLFDETRKQPLPVMPSHIAVITSPQGAAIRDVISVMRRRFPAVYASILPVQVQGDESVAQIVEAAHPPHVVEVLVVLLELHLGQEGQQRIAPLERGAEPTKEAQTVARAARLRTSCSLSRVRVACNF